MPHVSTRARALFVSAIAICGALAIAAEPARGGAYNAALCDPSVDAWHADASFERSSRHYSSAADCGIGGDGLSVSHDTSSAAIGAWGAWTVRAPAGTAITRIAASAAGRWRGGQVPELVAGPPRDPQATFGHPGEAARRFAWSGSQVLGFAARLRCRRPAGCRSGDASSVRVKRIALRLVDSASPRLEVGGSLLDSRTRRGLQTIAPSASDVGAGVRRFLVQVNGQPVTARTISCNLSGATALRLRPCPGTASASLPAATAASPFRQGPNRVRVCVTDYAATTDANRVCAARSVRIDNLCPVSQVATGATLRAHLHRAHRKQTIAGRLLDDNGKGAGGAAICVGARVRMPSAIETVLATPTTGADGRFRVAIPRGPSRQLRVAYWPNDVAPIERYQELRVQAHPRLTTSPHHPIRNGSRVRFRVHLPGPENARRRVRIQARAEHRWLDVRSGRTRARGTLRTRYRFRNTTERRTYAFRAWVAKQPGYPYEAGRSRVRHVTVIGK